MLTVCCFDDSPLANLVIERTVADGLFQLLGLGVSWQAKIASIGQFFFHRVLARRLRMLVLEDVEFVPAETA